MAEIILRNPAALWILPLLWLVLLILGWRRRFKPFGAFLLRLIIVVLAVFSLARPVLPTAATVSEESTERIIVLVDQSASLTEADRQSFRTEAARLAQQYTSSHLSVLYFADQPILIPSVSAQTADGALPLNPELSNLHEALAMGATLLHNQAGRLVLLSDGLPTVDPDLDPVLAQLTRQNTPVDVLLPSATGRDAADNNDIRLLNLSVPPVLREGETFEIAVTLHSRLAAQAHLQLGQDRVLLAESELTLEPGLNRFTFEGQAEIVGPHTFQATVSALDPADAQPFNNSFSAFAEVYPPPQILVVGDDLVPVSRFTTALDEAGFVTERIRSSEIPSQLSALEPYAGMVLLNVSARNLQLEQMLAIQEFVRSLGRGLLVTGGRNSFSLGEYEDTPLADVLPLSLEPPPREERPPVALLLIIDHSGSMIERQFPATKLAMAKEAAIRATDILGPDDLIGVLIFDNQFEWTVPFQAASDGATLLDIQSKIATIAGGGGTRILQALQIGLPALVAQDTFDGPRHAVLLSDGKSFDGLQGRADYDALVDMAVEFGITLSTIAIGDDADQELLSRVAERGQGRYHFAAEPDELPALTIAESDILRSSAVQEGEYRPSIFAPHSILRGFSSNEAAPEGSEMEIPNLSGYIGLTPKPQAEIALQVGPGDPLLGVWGYGLGRVGAWSSDVGLEWATAWYTWPEAARFWGQVVGYTLPAPNLGLLQVSAEVERAGVVTLIAEGVTATGQTVDLARTEATLITPAGREVPLNLRQISPGRYQQRLHLPDSGAYQVLVRQARPAGLEETATIGFVVPYSAEYALPDTASGTTLLSKIADVTGGRTFLLGDVLPPLICDPASQDCPTETNPIDAATELWPWFLQAALILWPLEIAWRRWGRLRIQ